MTISHIVTLISVAVSALTALAVAHLHRKQMRQIELFRIDQSAGLSPMPGRLIAFVKYNKALILGVSGSAAALGLELTSHAPITRTSILIISVNVALIAMNIGAALFLWFERRVTTILATIADLQEGHLNVTARSVDALQVIARMNEDDTGA